MMQKTLIGQAVALVLALTPLAATPGALQSQMDTVFNSMVNVTKPGVFEGQRRGVVSAGSVYVRNKIVDTNVVTFVPPSWKGGCGGIDFFGGSFSFIDADQFIQLMRAVASNAAGYAFQLALDNTCTQCMTYINDLRRVIQLLNQYAGNSCQLAQGIVNDLAPAQWEKSRSDASIKTMTSGLFTDIFEANSEKDGKSSMSAAASDPNISKEIFGNIVWQTLQSQHVDTWFVNSFANKYEGYEMLMSMTGTYIIDKPVETDVGNAGKSDSTPLKPLARLVHLNDLVEGGNNVEVYKCDDSGADSQCLKPKIVKVDIDSLRRKIYNLLVGPDGHGGMIASFADGQTKMSEQGMALFTAMPVTAGVMIRNFALRSPGMAQELAHSLSYAVAASMAYDMAKDMMYAVRAAVATSNKPQTKELTLMIDHNLAVLSQEYEDYCKEHPSMASVTRYYHDLNAMIHNPELTNGQSQSTLK